MASRLASIHQGLPDGTPWLVRVVLRSRWFLITTFALTLLVGATAVFAHDWLLGFDETLSDWVRGGDQGLAAARAVTHLGSPVLAAAAGALFVAVIWHKCRAAAMTMASLILAALTTDLVLKLLIDRPRPSGQLVSTQFGSFPSGHTIHAVVIFGLLPLLLWVLTNRLMMLRLGFALFVLVVALVGWSRVRLGAHWPSDVLASVLIGVSLLIAAEQLLTSSWAADRCSDRRHHST